MAPRTSALSGSCFSNGPGLPSRSSERKRLRSVSACLVAFFIGIWNYPTFCCAILCIRRRFVASLLGPFFVQLGVFLGNFVQQFHHLQLFFQIFVELKLEKRRQPQRQIL